MKAPNYERWLDPLPSGLVHRLKDEIVLFTIEAMAYFEAESRSYEERNNTLLAWIEDRWLGHSNKIYLSSDIEIAASVILHKFGWISRWHEKYPELEGLFSARPQLPAKKPRRPKQTTQYQEHDLLSIEYRGLWHCAFVQSIEEDSGGRWPVVEFFDPVFRSAPKGSELIGASARGRIFDDGKIHRQLYGLYGLTEKPDPAAQVTVLKSGFNHPPEASRLAAPIGLYALRNLHEVPAILSSGARYLDTENQNK